jgi:hypothetical protein
MKTMAQSLAELVKTNRVTMAVAESSLSDASELRTLVRAA